MTNEVTEGIRDFIFAGNSSFTIFQEPNIQVKYYIHKSDDYPMWFLTTEDAISSKMIYQGYLKKDGSFTSSKKSPKVVNEKAIKALQWVVRHADNMNDKVHVLHHGKCAVCGRKLTDAKSLQCGIGPSCRKKIGLS